MSFYIIVSDSTIKKQFSMGRWGRQSPGLELEAPPSSPPPLPPRNNPFIRQSSFTKIGYMFNSALNGKKPQSKYNIRNYLKNQLQT